MGFYRVLKQSSRRGALSRFARDLIKFLLFAVVAGFSARREALVTFAKDHVRIQGLGLGVAI